MNQTTEGLQARYVMRFLITAVAVMGATVSSRLILLGKTGDYLLPVGGIALVCFYVSWKGTGDLHRRWMQLRQLRVMEKHGPYDRHECVPPHEAARQFGDDDGPNMWR